MRMDRVVAFLAALVVCMASTAIAPPPANACSCVPYSPEEQLERPDTSFIGVAEAVVAESSKAGMAVVRFSVIEPIKGDAAGEVYGVVETFDSSCGEPELIPGARYFGREALIQMSDGFVWEACTSLDPSQVDILRPGLDAPVTDKPAVIMAIGDKRDTQVRLLNEDGAVVAYVQDAQLHTAPDGPPGRNTLCENGDLASMVVDGDPVFGDVAIRVRDLSTLEYRDLPVDADPTSTVRTCTADGELLLATPDDLVLLDSNGNEIRRFPYGESTSGWINSTATHFSWFSMFQQIKTVPIIEGPTTTIDIRNHTGWNIATSPDGSHHAVLIWSPIEATMTLLIADNSGETVEIVSNSFSEPVRWLDNSRVAAGPGIYDMAAATVVDSPLQDPYSSVKAIGPRVLERQDYSFELHDLDTREALLIPLDESGYARSIVPLPAAIDVTGEGFTPPERTALPIPGETPPGSLLELEAALESSGRSFDFTPVAVADSGRPVPAPAASQPEEPEADKVILSEPDGPTWWLWGLLMFGAIAGLAMVGRIRTRT